MPSPPANSALASLQKGSGAIRAPIGSTLARIPLGAVWRRRFASRRKAQGLKPRDRCVRSARLKSCPDTKLRSHNKPDTKLRSRSKGSYQGTSSLVPPLAQKLGGALAPVVPFRQLCATIRRKWPSPRETRIPTKFPPTGGLSSSPQERTVAGPAPIGTHGNSLH